MRATLASPGYGHPAHTEVARGHGPCRHCLRTFRVGEEKRILFTWDPFAGLEPRHDAPLPDPPHPCGPPDKRAAAPGGTIG